MIKKFASDALGLSDIGRIIEPSDYDKVDADDYIFNEDGERIFFVIKTKADEYCFTNLGLIHLDGTTAMSKKRALKRFSFRDDLIGGVWLETAGTTDLDVEIKFKIGEEDYSIDVTKKQLESLKDLYKALYAISKLQRENREMLKYSAEALATAAAALGRASGEGAVDTQFGNVTQYAFDWKRNCYQQFMQKDYSEIFERYLEMHRASSE